MNQQKQTGKVTIFLGYFFLIIILVGVGLQFKKYTDKDIDAKVEEPKVENVDVFDNMKHKMTFNYYYNYENGLETNLLFSFFSNNKCYLSMTQNNCIYRFDCIIEGKKIEAKFRESECHQSSPNKDFFYDVEKNEVYIFINGQKFTFTRDDTKHKVDFSQFNTSSNQGKKSDSLSNPKNQTATEDTRIEKLSGEFKVNKIWNKEHDGWYDVMILTDINVKANTDGNFTIESFDFLMSFDDKAPLANMKGYDSAYVDDPTYIKTFVKDGITNITYSGKLNFNSRQQQYAYKVNYSIMVKDGKIFGMAINRSQNPSAYWMRFSQEDKSDSD